MRCDAQFVELVEAQGGLCALGHAVGDEELVVDHDHVTGAVRGVVCRMCNVGLGHFRDNPALMRAAALYIEARPHTPRWPAGAAPGLAAAPVGPDAMQHVLSRAADQLGSAP